MACGNTDDSPDGETNLGEGETNPGNTYTPTSTDNPPLNLNFETGWQDMTAFIKDEVEPWLDWAVTDGPCMASSTAADER